MTYFAGNCVKGYFLVSLLILLCTGYVYRVNSKRKADDPEKRDFHPVAIPLSLFWPILLLIMASLFILRALAYGAFLILFTLAMVIIRKPFLVKLILKAETKIGTLFLKVNTFLIRAFFPQVKPGVIK